MDGPPNISLDQIRDRIVSPNTLKTYLVDVFALLFWLLDERIECLTEHGITILTEYRSSSPEDCPVRVLFRQNKEAFIQHLREAEQTAVIRLDVLTPLIFMDHIRQIRNVKTGNFLSKSAYGNRRAGLFHLYCLHNKIGLEPNFSSELTLLFRGFFSNLAAMVGEQQPEVEMGDENELDVDAVELERHARRRRLNFNTWKWNSDESKKPMSVELLKAVCGWLLERATPTDVWTQCYLLLCWNLCCRSNNVAYLKLSDISWCGDFDCFAVYFAHTKTDQTGKESRYARHIYANPTCVPVCPVTALAFYFSTNFNISAVSNNSLLFPGKNQEQRFENNLLSVLYEP